MRVVAALLLLFPAFAVFADNHQGSADAGAAQAAVCAACHGETGNSMLPNNPHIAGQNFKYLFRQMQLIRDGERPAPLMIGQLDNKTDQDLMDLAAYYESQAPKRDVAADADLELGERIYRAGILDKGVAACAACHGPSGAGNAPAGFPRIAGQESEYFINQMTAYREGQRLTDEYLGGVMRQIAIGLTDGEIAAVANYAKGLR